MTGAPAPAAGEARPAARPLSVVVAASNGPAALGECLAALAADSGESVEVIAVANFPGAGAAAHSYPGVRVVEMPPETTVPELRAAGLAAARGAWVAMTEDNCTVDSGWTSSVLAAASAAPGAALGGPVEHASTGRAIDWAVYFHEYGRYARNGRTEPHAAPTLPGPNVVYRRNALEALGGDALADGLAETFVNAALQERGERLWFVPAAGVTHRKRYRAVDAFAACFHHGRAYAGRRVAGASALKRAGLAAGSMALPVLLPARIAAAALRRRRHAGPLVRSFPLVVALMASWAAGEFLGYVAGAGSSAARWR